MNNSSASTSSQLVERTSFSHIRTLSASRPQEKPRIEDEIQFLPTRILDDWMRRRPLTRTVTDDFDSFTILTLRLLLKRLESSHQAGPTEDELLTLLSAQCPQEVWMNRQQIRDTIRQLAEDADDSDGSADSAASTCSREFAPFVPALHEMLRVNDDQRWEMHELRAEGKLDEVRGDGLRTRRYYEDYIGAFSRMPANEDGS